MYNINKNAFVVDRVYYNINKASASPEFFFILLLMVFIILLLVLFIILLLMIPGAGLVGLFYLYL
jgi:hypothetical protein